MILDYAMPSATTDANRLDVYFTRTREQTHDRALATLAHSAGRNWLGLARTLLWHDVHVGSTRRADKLLEALKLELPRTPESKGYLAPLVQRLQLDIRERHLPLHQDIDTVHFDGILPRQNVDLANALPHVESLAINISVAGGWLSQTDMFHAIDAIVRRPCFKHLEITTTELGFRNAFAIFGESPQLNTLKLRGLQPSGTLLLTRHIFRDEDARLLAARRTNLSVPCPFSSTLTQVVLWECRLLPQELSELCSSSLSSLKHLVIHRLDTISFDGSSIAFPTAVLVTTLTPLVQQLEHLHVVLSASPRLDSPSIPFALDVLSTQFSNRLKTLVIGGPGLFSIPTLFDHFDQLGDAFRPSVLTFTQCAFRDNPRGASSGLKASQLVDALDHEWTREIELLDVEGMTDEGEEREKSWTTNDVERLKDKVRDVNAERAHAFGRKPIELRWDEGLEEREREEREWEESRRNRNRRSTRGRNRR